MTTSMQIFNFDMFPVRIVKDDAGEAWFVAKDVCEILGLDNVSQALSGLDDDEKNSIDPNIISADVGFYNMMTASGMNMRPVIPEAGRGGRPLSLINEPGLYSLVLRSNKSEAKTFKRWITHEVLPAIRKTGGYIPAGTSEDEAVIMARAVQIMHSTIERQKARELEDMPKIALANAITATRGEILTGTCAKLIYQATGFDIGEKRLFQYLRENGFVCATPNRWNVPTQRSIDQGLMRIKEEPYISINGNRHIAIVPVVTTKGQLFFINHFRKLAEALPTAPED